MAIAARVSSEPHAEAHTLASQLAAWRTRVAADGYQRVREHAGLDAGDSGATLVRPGVERLRALVAAGGVDRLSGHAPARVARPYASHVLLSDAWQRAGVEVVCLNRALGQTPEDARRLPVQGLVAEDARATSLERRRRGTRQAAYAGAVSVLAAAPYG